jgi:regulator of sirC expression with transglutaminase-like and TPR domain
MRLSSASHGFVDPFHPHKELWEPDLRAFLEKATGGRIPYEPRMLMPCSNKQILVRVLRNIKAMHVDRAEPAAAVSAIDRILTLSPTEAHERRERGILHFGLGHFRNAAEDLRAYLRTADRVHDRTYIEWKIEEAEAHLWEIN